MFLDLLPQRDITTIKLSKQNGWRGAAAGETASLPGLLRLGDSLESGVR